jgi:hypothetical protein
MEHFPGDRFQGLGLTTSRSPQNHHVRIRGFARIPIELIAQMNSGAVGLRCFPSRILDWLQNALGQWSRGSHDSIGSFPHSIPHVFFLASDESINFLRPNV